MGVKAREALSRKYWIGTCVGESCLCYQLALYLAPQVRNGHSFHRWFVSVRELRIWTGQFISLMLNIWATLHTLILPGVVAERPTRMRPSSDAEGELRRVRRYVIDTIQPWSLCIRPSQDPITPVVNSETLVERSKVLVSS
ncbi:hypothetical protein OG21DRAFT_943444 [Imleria badia]|nr:hypothetical protein OG21DRAFT_943444 [Imleria badia]